MYPRNAASPERIAVGTVVAIADGAVQTSGVSIKVMPQGGSASAGGGTTGYEEGIVHYLPTQAETNYASFMVIAYKASCIPASVTVVTSATSVTGTVDVGAISGDSAAADNLETACDNYSATRGLAGTALPAAAADAAGGLPISDAGGLDMDAKLANTNEVTAARMGALTDLIDGGRLDLILDAILTDTGTTLDGKIDTIDGIVDTIVARVIGTLAAGTHNAQSGDSYAVVNSGTHGNAALKTLIDTVDDFVDTEVAAILAAVDTEVAAIKTKTDYLPSATAGAAGGVFIAGTNAPVTITGSGPALTLTSTGSNGSAMVLTSHGSGHGMEFVVAGLTSYAIFTGTAANGIQDIANLQAGDIADIIADTNELQLNQGNWLTATGFSTHNAADVVTALGTGSTLTAIPWNASWDTEVQSECTDALNAYDPPTKAETDAAATAAFTTAMTESYAADGAAPTPAQALFLIQQALTEFAITSTTITVKKLDGSTTAATFTLDDETTPTSRTRAS